MTFKHKLSVRLALLKDALLLVSAAAIVGCEKPVQLAGPAALVTRVVVSPRQVALNPNQKSPFTAVGLTAAGDTADVRVTWSATGGSITDTFSTGRIHHATYQPSAVPGNYLVIATDPPETGVADTSAVTVIRVPVASVALTPAVASMLLGATLHLTATAQDSIGSALPGRSISWSSSAPAIAAVNDSGLVTANAVGSATVTAASEGKSASATITVSSVPVASVTLSPASASIRVGSTQQLAAVTKDSAGSTLTGRVVTWSSSNTAVATVSTGGLVTGLTAGLATIAATSDGKSGTSTVTVTPVSVASVVVGPAATTIAVGGIQQLTAVTKDSTGNTLTGRVVTWSSSNAAVATVSASGVVTGQAPGVATVTATSEGKSGTAALTVQAAPPPVQHAGYYVAPTGSSAGAGTIGSPWDLGTALTGPAAVHPGDTIWLRGGTYSGAFTSSLTGTAAQPIIVRQYPGDRATISGNLTIFGAYTWFWGFEVVSPNPAGGSTNGIQSRSTGAKYINLVIHDAQGVGLTLFDDIGGTGAKPDQEAYGCLLYDNGSVNNLSHGTYSNNTTGYRKLRDNIVFNNWALGINAYGSANNVHNTTFDGNISFNNGSISGYAGGPSDLFIGGPVVTGAVVTNNYLYRLHTATATADIGYYFGPVNQDLVFTGNYAYGLVEIRDWVTATVTGNTLYSTSSPYAVGARGEFSARGNLGGHTWRGNTWYGDPTLPQWGYGPAGTIPGVAYDNATWMATTGLTGSGTYGGRVPPNLVVVRPNAYEAGRANIVVYNWAQLGSVSIDVAGVLNVGDRFVVQNAQDFYGTPVLSGTYTGAALQLPTAGVPAPTPIGRGVPGPATGPTFNAFVLLKTP